MPAGGPICIKAARDGMTWTIPNILTAARILAAPGVAVVFLVFDRPLADWIAVILFIGAALTDFLDGWLARRLDQISALGKMLDPIADKAMVIIALMTVVWTHAQAALLIVPAVLIVLREVLVSGLREYLGDIKLAVTGLAKVKTAVQMIAIGCLLGAEPLRTTFGGGNTADMVGITLLFLAAALTAQTGWDYFRKGLAYIRDKEDA